MGRKQLCEKEKLLVMRLVLQTRENKGLFWKGLSSQNKKFTFDAKLLYLTLQSFFFQKKI